MESEKPTTELFSDSMQKNNVQKNVKEQKEIKGRKKFIKNFFFGWIQDNYDRLFILILLTALIIRILVYTKTNDQALWWDAADYMSSAKRWAGVNTNLIDIWYYRRGFLWALISALFFKIGLGELSIRFLVVLFSTGIVFISYLLISEMFDKKTALLTSLPIALSWIFIFFTGRLLTEIPATFFLLTALFFFWKGFMKNSSTKYFILFGLFSALTVLIRMQYLMFAIPIFIFALLKEKYKLFINKKLWLSLVIFIILLLPHLYIYYKHFGNPVLDLTNYYLGIEGLSKSGEVGVELAKTSDLFLYFNNLPYILDANQRGYSSLFTISPIYSLFVIGFFLFFIDLFLGVDKIFNEEFIQKKFFVLSFIVFGFLFLGYMAPQLEQRYVMPIMPFLFLVAIYPIQVISGFLKEKINKKTIIIVFLIILLLLLIPNYKAGFNLIESKKLSYQEVKMAGEWIKQNSLPSDIVIGSGLPQLTYYSERSVYPFELAYRRDLAKGNESDLDNFIKEKKPRYLVISAYEREEPWAFGYPQKHPEMLVPVQAYPN
ncbi:MAG: glycosyltransferase family 39 protein, partial [Nanoarchaeota archaeon]